MKLQPHEFRVVVEEVDEDLPELDEESPYEAELDEDLDPDDFEEAPDEEGEAEDEDEDPLEAEDEDPLEEEHEAEEAIDWEDVFDEATWTSPEPGSLSFAKDLAEAIEGGMAEKMKGIPAYRRPYTPHPEAVKKDSVVVYDEKYKKARDAYQKLSGQVASEARAIANQLRRVLFTRSLSRSQRDQRRGRLDRRKLYTVATPNNVNPNKRIFAKKVEGETQDVAVGILVDQSGSMTGTKIETAQQCAIAFGDALSQLEPLGVSFGVWGFDANGNGSAPTHAGYDRYDPLRLHWYKGLDEEWRHVAPRIGQMQSLSQNIDGECVRWAAQQLLECDVQRRVLFVLSDGRPAGTSYEETRARLSADLKLAVQQCEAAGVEMVGIGFLDQSVKGYYPKHTIVHSVGELGPKVLNLIRDTFKVGGRGAA